MLCPQIFIAQNSCIIATETQWTPSKCPKLHTKQTLLEKPPNRWKKLEGSIPTVLIPNLPDISADFSPPTPQCNIHQKKNSWAPTGLSEGGREGGEDKKEGNNRKLTPNLYKPGGERKKERKRPGTDRVKNKHKKKETTHIHTHTHTHEATNKRKGEDQARASGTSTPAGLC
jgi:hypothetical protein